jgi:hypothetical protein
VFLVSYYATILPIGLLWTILGLILFYWSNKYEISRNRSLKYNMSTDIAVEMIEMLEFSLVIYSVIYKKCKYSIKIIGWKFNI